VKVLQRSLAALSVVALGYGFWLAMTTRPDAIQGEFARVFHVHVPSAWLAFLAFGVTLVGSLVWLAAMMDWCRLNCAAADVRSDLH